MSRLHQVFLRNLGQLMNLEVLYCVMILMFLLIWGLAGNIVVSSSGERRCRMRPNPPHRRPDQVCSKPAATASTMAKIAA